VRNFRIIHSQITPLIRVSTAAILYSGFAESPVPYYLYETWCFSKDPRRKSFQVVHGTSHDVDFWMLTRAIKTHRHIANNLKEIFAA